MKVGKLRSSLSDVACANLERLTFGGFRCL